MKQLDVALAPVKPVTDSHPTPCKVGPFGVPIDEEIQLLLDPEGRPPIPV